MDTIIIIGIVLIIIPLYGILKETKNNGDILHNFRNDWEKEHGRSMNKSGNYEDAHRQE